jgi:hypothetical protein
MEVSDRSTSSLADTWRGLGGRLVNPETGLPDVMIVQVWLLSPKTMWRHRPVRHQSLGS